MKSHHFPFVTFIFIAALLLLESRLTVAQTLPSGDDAKVTQIISADTINVTINNTGFTIGLIGLDAPNPANKTAKAECFATQSQTFVQGLLRGKTMRVTRDSSDFDPTGRLMRYVYLQDGRLLNEVLLHDGYARTANVSPDVQLQARFQKAEQEAQAAKRGLWSVCAQPITKSPAPTPVVATSNGSCPTFNVGDVVKQGPRADVLSTLADNACVKLVSNGGAGIYRWHPAGSRIRRDQNLLVRWQDGVLSIWRHSNGHWIATGLKDYKQFFEGGLSFPARGPRDETLTHMGDNNQILGVESTRTFLLQDMGVDNLVTLIDAFQIESGDYFMPKFSYYESLHWFVAAP